MTIKGGAGVRETKTYAIPLAITGESSDITVKDENARHCIYLVKDMCSGGDAYKGKS